MEKQISSVLKNAKWFVASQKSFSKRTCFIANIPLTTFKNILCLTKMNSGEYHENVLMKFMFFYEKEGTLNVNRSINTSLEITYTK